MNFIDQYLRFQYLEEYLEYPEEDRLELYRLLNLKVKQLHKLAKDRNIKGCSKMRKRDLILRIFTFYIFKRNGIRLRPNKTILPMEVEKRKTLTDLYNKTLPREKPKIVLSFD